MNYYISDLHLFHKNVTKEVTDRVGKDTVHVVLSHYPILMWKNQHRGFIHLYGHLHASEEEVFFQRCLKELNQMDLEHRR